MKPKIILVSGSKRVGKDTFFNLLNKLYPNEFIGYSFADQLKEDLNPITQKMFRKNTLDLNDKEKEIFRNCLISYGCAWRELDIDHWVKVVDEDIDNGMKETNFIPVIRDVRFCSELEFFKGKYGENHCVVVGIERENAPEATDEEKKNWPFLKKSLDYSINWIDAKGEINKLEPYVIEFYKKYFK